MTVTVKVKAHRQIVRGKDRDGNDTGAWLEMERIDEATIERGSGLNYQKTVWKFDWPKDSDSNDLFDTAQSDQDAGTRIRIVKRVRQPDGPMWVDVHCIATIKTERASGVTYQKTKRDWYNKKSEKAKRLIIPARVHGSDGISTLDIEMILKYLHERGSGVTYQGTEWLKPFEMWPLLPAENLDPLPPGRIEILG